MIFIKNIDNRISSEMKLAATSDPRTLQALRNIKSEFSLAKSRNQDATDVSIIMKMAKSREETAKIYEGVNTDLWLQEIAELRILEPFIPAKPSDEKVIEFLNTLDIKKEMKNFKNFKTELEKHFGQEIDSTIISSYIKGQ